jgi:dynein heavy chain, axonemal
LLFGTSIYLFFKIDYNSILRAIVTDERKLFSERVKSLDHKILPGLGKLTWASQGVVELFVKECRRHAGDINKVIIIIYF